MTAIPGDESFDPEDAIERVTERAYMRYLIHQFALFFAFFGIGVLISATGLVFGVVAVFYVPQWMIGFLVSFVLADVFWMARQRKQAAPLTPMQERMRAVTDGDRATASLDRLQEIRARWAEPLPSLRKRLRTGEYWFGWATVVVYTGCVALVLVHMIGPIAGAVIAATYALGDVVFRRRSVFRKRVLRVLNAAAFADPRPPRDTPEM